MKVVTLTALVILSSLFASSALAQGMADHNMSTMQMESMAALEGLEGEEFEIAFMSMMIAHHQGAIQMAQWILERTENADIRSAAEQIIADQQAENEQLSTWLADWYGAEPDSMMMGMMTGETDMMMADMEGHDNPDLAFLEQMSLHHTSAIDMAQLALLRAEHAELRELAKNIIVAQAQEIAEFQAWLDAL